MNNTFKMEQEDNILVGLDIGTTKICVVVGRKNEFGKLEVLGMGSAPSYGVTRGIVSNIEKTVNAIRSAVYDAEEQSGINIRVVNVGIAGQHVRSSIHHGSVTRDPNNEEFTQQDVNRLTNDMHRIVTPPGNEIIHVMPQLYTVDYEDGIVDPIGMSGVKLEADFHIVTAKTNAIRNVKKCVERAGLEIEELILEPLASSLAVLSEEEKEAGVCLIDIGGGTTDMAIFHENIICHTKVIPLGGSILTKDIKEGCSILFDQAEALKTKFGKAISEQASHNEIVSIPGLRERPPTEISLKNLACIIEARVEEIFEMVHTEIITSGYDDKLAGGIVITGGGSQLQHIKQLCEYMTGQDARIGYPNEHLGKSKIDAVKTPIYATAIGLVLAGYKTIDDRKKQSSKLNQRTSGTNTRMSREGKSNDFFKKFIEKTKEFFIDEHLKDDDDYK